MPARSLRPEDVASAKTIPNLADDDEPESTLVGTLAPEDTLVGSVPKAPGVEDDEDDTAHENTLVGDPWDTTEVNGRPSEVRALRSTPRTPPSRAKAAIVKPAPKPMIPRATPKVAATPSIPPPAIAPSIPPPAVAPSIPPPAVAPSIPPAAVAPSIPPPAVAPCVPPPFTPSISPPRAPSIPPLDHTAPYLSRTAMEAEDDAAFRRASAGPLKRTAEVLLAVTLFVAYLCRETVERFVALCRPLWARAARDAATRMHRR